MKKTKKKEKSKEALKLLLKVKEKKVEEKKEPKEKEEKLEEEVLEPEFFEAPKEELSPRKKASLVLEETFKMQDQTPDATLEETLAGVETEKKNSNEKDFYSTASYGPNSGEDNKKYSNPIHVTNAQTRQREIGPLTTADIRINPNTTTALNSETMSEMKKYSSQDPDEKYSVANLERLNPNDLNRDRDRNPFLQDAERIETKYE